MKLLSIIILFLISPLQTNDGVLKKEIVIEDRDLQFVNEWWTKNTDKARNYKAAYFKQLLNKDRLLLIIKVSREQGLNPSIILAQMFIESKHSSKLKVAPKALQKNNYFGIEGMGFHSFEQCFNKYVKIVTRFKEGNYWNIRGMTRVYAENPKYYQLIKSVVKSNNFDEFDKHIKTKAKQLKERNENISDR